MRHAGQRFSARLVLAAGCALAGLVFLVFALAAMTVALTERFGLLEALGIMAGVALAAVLLMVGLLARDARRGKQLAARRAALDRQLLRSATFAAAIPRAANLTARSGIGLGLVALGAALVLARGRGRAPDDED